MEIKKPINQKKKKVVGMVIAGIVVIIFLIVTAVTTATALTQGIQTTHLVNALAQNISIVLKTQEKNRFKDRM